MLTDDIALSLSIEQGVATLQIDERRPLGTMLEFCLVSSFRYVHGYACWLVDSRIPLAQVDFPFGRPPHGSAYSLLFPGSVRFGQDRARMSFLAQYLALPARRDEQAARSMLRNALPLSVHQYRRDRLLASRARALMVSAPAAHHNAPTLASALNVSVRTLHRQLEKEGTSLQALKDTVRREQAIEQLSRTTQPIKQIAHAIGFASEKTFARAFRHWTGASPSEYRLKVQATS